MPNRTSTRIGVLAAAASLVLLGAGSSAGVSAAPASPAVELCADGSVARVADDATAKEPALYSRNEPTPTGSCMTCRPCRTAASPPDGLPHDR